MDVSKKRRLAAEVQPEETAEPEDAASEPEDEVSEETESSEESKE